MQPNSHEQLRKLADSQKKHQQILGGMTFSRRGHRESLLLVSFVFIALTGLGVWAAVSEIDQLARAPGQVIASARTQVVQAADNGILQNVLVTEGQQVIEGQRLAVMDQVRAQAAYQDSRNKVAALEAKLARLVAEVYGRDVEFGESLAVYPVFRENQQALFERRQSALVEGIEALEKSARLIRAELAITEPLLANGDVGEVEVLRLRRQLSETRGQIVNTRNKFFEDAQAEMTRAEEELAEQHQLLRERETILEQTVITAPMDGVVNRIEISTLGASVRAGEILMELHPTQSELIVEAKFSPADYASLGVGVPTTVKLDAYDSSIYGGLEGEIIFISPDALKESDPRTGDSYFYRVRVRVQKPDQSPNQRTREIVVAPGMTVLVEARTKSRTVMSYLTKPITKTFAAALTER